MAALAWEEEDLRSIAPGIVGYKAGHGEGFKRESKRSQNLTRENPVRPCGLLCSLLEGFLSSCFLPFIYLPIYSLTYLPELPALVFQGWLCVK